MNKIKKAACIAALTISAPFTAASAFWLYDEVTTPNKTKMERAGVDLTIPAALCLSMFGSITGASARRLYKGDEKKSTKPSQP